MKKTILFILFLITAIVIFDNINTGFITLKLDEIKEVEGRTVTIKQISSNSILVDVSGVQDIINLNSNKVVNDVKINIEEIFYVNEKEDRYVKLNLESNIKLVCGDGKCEEGETKDSCCKDCKCDAGYICEDDTCVMESKSKKYNECKNDKDCDDKNEFTVDKCEGEPKKCKHIGNYQCQTNEECDDKNDCTKDECINKECFNKKTPDCKITTEKTQDVIKIEEKGGFLSKLFNKLFGWL